jgi:hypothetical protein
LLKKPLRLLTLLLLTPLLRLLTLLLLTPLLRLLTPLLRLLTLLLLRLKPPSNRASVLLTGERAWPAKAAPFFFAYFGACFWRNRRGAGSPLR